MCCACCAPCCAPCCAVEPSSGRIVIDGIDTSSIGLYDLRSRLALVPQVGCSCCPCKDCLCRLGLAGLARPAPVSDSNTCPTSQSACRMDDTLHAVQDPVVFSGSVRSNLDPFGDAGGDDRVWGALTQVGG